MNGLNSHSSELLDKFAISEVSLDVTEARVKYESTFHF